MFRIRPWVAMLAGSLAVACASLPGAPPTGRVVAGVIVPPPLPPRLQTDTFWGTEVRDPYRYVENDRDPEVAGWMKQQAEATAAILARIPGRTALLDRIRQLDADAAGALGGVQRTDSGHLFFARREPTENQFRLVMRTGLQGPERVLVDPEAIGKRVGQPLAIQDFAASEDGRWLAYSLQVAGSEIGELHLVDVTSGRALVEPIDRIRYAGVRWLRDGSGFFFQRLRENYANLPDSEKFGDRTTHFFSMQSRSSQAVLSPLRNPDLKLPAYASASLAPVPDSNVTVAFVVFGVDRSLALLLADAEAAAAGRARWISAVERTDEARSLGVTRDWIYLLSARNAPRHRILRMPLAAPDVAKAEVIVPAGDEIVVSMAVARDALYYTKRRGAAMQLVRVPHGAPDRAETVALPFEGTVSITAADSRRDGILFSVVAWTRAVQRFEYAPAQAAQPMRITRVTLTQPGSFDAPSQVTSREVLVPSHDGTPVPVSIIARHDLKLDGSNPTILYGYGAYGVTENPFFNPRLLAWIERGGVYVYAHVRGGGMLGTEWHEAGRKATKPNTWRDGLAVAQWLIANGYTAPERLGILGGSAGGIFVGGAINERPDLFAAAVPAVPTMDMVRAELTANGAANVPEFGTVKDEAGFRALHAMSSYSHVKDGARYPATMLVHGVNDIRVPVWQSTKYALRLAAATTGGPVLMRLDYALGHGQGATRAQQQEQIADIWSFMLWQFGVPEFQPKR
jgi:prolyl oligopeptidase